MFSDHNTNWVHQPVLLADLNLVNIQSAHWDLLEPQRSDPDLKIVFQWITYRKKSLLTTVQCLALPQETVDSVWTSYSEG